MTSSNSARITIAIVSIMAATVLLTAYLNFAKFETALGRLEQNRYGVLFFDLRDTIERSLKLGASLNALSSTQDALERLKDLEDKIQDITVFDDSGVIVFSSTLVSGKQKVPANWASVAKATSGPVWYVEEGSTVVMGTSLKNAFDKPVGGLALQYSKRDRVVAANQVFFRLGTYAVAITLVLSIIASIIFMLYLRGISRSFTRISEWVRPLGNKSSPDLGAESPTNAIEEAVLHYRSKTGETIKELESNAVVLNEMEVKA